MKWRPGWSQNIRGQLLEREAAGVRAALPAGAGGGPGAAYEAAAALVATGTTKRFQLLAGVDGVGGSAAWDRQGVAVERICARGAVCRDGCRSSSATT